MDVKHENDINGVIYYGSNLIDYGTNFSMYELIPSKHPEVVAKAVFESWCRWAGVPDIIAHDLGGEFSGEMTNLAERWHVDMKVGPTEAPWQQAKIERHGAVLGDIVRLTVEEQAVDNAEEMKLVMYYASMVKNRRVDRSGYSPRERVFGSSDRLPGSAIDSFENRENVSGDEQAMINGAHRRSLRLRSAAMAALVRLDHADRYRRAVVAGLRTPTLDVPQGTQVFYWRVGKTRKNMKGRKYRDFDR